MEEGLVGGSASRALWCDPGRPARRAVPRGLLELLWELLRGGFPRALIVLLGLPGQLHNIKILILVQTADSTVRQGLLRGLLRRLRSGGGRCWRG
eukprot:4939117-Pyramimonas_sp.AAC.1